MLTCQTQTAKVEVPLVGSGYALVYRSDRVPGRRTAPAADVRGQGLGGLTLDVHHSYDPATRVLLQGDGERRRVQAVTSGQELLVASVDAGQVFAFDAEGRHLRTVDATTGTTLQTFQHDPAGRLVSARDVSGQELGFARDAEGHLSTITLPGGATMPAQTDHDGYLIGLTRPSGAAVAFTYAKGGLLASQSGTGLEASYTYDAGGLLVGYKVRGGTTSLTRRSVPGGYSVAIRTPAGRTSLYSASRRSGRLQVTLVDTAGGRSEEIFSNDLSRRFKGADGSTIDTTLARDPRFGMQAPIPARVVTSTPAGRRTTVEESREAGAAGLLGGAPLTRTVTRDGQATRTTYDPSAHTLTSTDPTGVVTVRRLDDHGRVNHVDGAGTNASSTYDAAGHLTSVRSGSGPAEQTIRWEEDGQRGTRTIVDAAGSRTVSELDADGNVTAERRPDGTVAEYDRDASGRLTAVWAPGREAYQLTTLSDGLPGGSFPPGSNGALEGTTRGYDADGALTSLAHGPTSRVAVDRDSAGRAQTVHLASGVITYTYRGAEAEPAGAVGPGEVTLADEHDGGLLTAERWTGPVSGSIKMDRDGAGLLSGVAVNGNTLSIERDRAGRATRIGDLRIQHDPKTGVVTSYALGAITEALTMDGGGRLATATIAAKGSAVAGLSFTRDAAGRTTSVAQSARGASSTSTYTYDANGRLRTETRGAARTVIGYDDNDNVVGGSGPGTAAGKVDESDRLTSRGNERFTYASDGTLRTRTGPAGTTTYTYDEHLALNRVETPAHRITYLIDGLARRIGKRVDGRLVQGFLWSGRRLVAELDGSGHLVSRFLYGDGPTPLAMLRNGHAYLLVADPIGTVRMAVDAQSGAIAQAIDTDVWGRVLADSAPGFQPFGFDGGLTDADTGLVRLGSRDYDPVTRRFTAPDPIGYDGGQTNLYAFAHNDPLDRADPDGLRDGDNIATGGVSLEVSGGLGYAGSFGFNVQWFGGPWNPPSVYYYGTAPEKDRAGRPVDNQRGAGGGISGTGNYGVIHNPSSNPADDFGGDTTSAGGSLGPVAGGVYRSPANSDRNAPSYAGGSAGLSAGTPSILYGKTHSTCFINCGHGHLFGDPHFLSHDGLAYDYQGAGEYVGLTSRKGDLAVQVRLQPYQHVGAVSRATAAAMSVAGDRVAVYRSDTSGLGALRLVINGQEVTAAQQTTTLPHGGAVTRRRRVIQVSWPDGTTFSYGRGVSGVLDIAYDLAAARKNDVSGLLGAYTGDPARSLLTRTGTTLAVNADQSVADPLALRAFADGWRLTQAQSLFDDLPGRDVARYTILGYPTKQASLDDLAPERRAAAQRVCSSTGLTGALLAACVLDVAVTGNAGMAASALSASGTPSVPPSSAGGQLPSAQPSPRVTAFPLAIGDTVTRDHPGPGAGHLELGQEQHYVFHVEKDQVVYVAATATVSEETPTYRLAKRSELRDAGGFGGLDGDIGRARVTSGDWVIQIREGRGDFTLALTSVPPDTHFRISPGDTVAPGSPGAGAGHLSARGQRQFYDFTAKPGYDLRIQHLGGCGPRSRIQYRVTAASDPDSRAGYLIPCLDYHTVLSEGGAYTVEVVSIGDTGDYSFRLLP